MVTKAQARKLSYDDEKVTDSTFKAGADDSESIPAGQVGEVAYAEVGEDGTLADYVAALLGQKPDPQIRTAKAKPFIDLYDNQTTPAQLPPDTQVRIVGRKPGERGGVTLMHWRNITNLRDTNPQNREPVLPQEPVIREGRYFVIQVRNQNQSITPVTGNSTWRLPLRTTDG